MSEFFADYCSKSPGCICEKCLYHRSSRCPNGSCYDDLRAKENPYDKAHPGKPPRTLWSKWNEEGEQAHWCRGGIFYQSHECDKFVEYDESRHSVKECLNAIVEVYQDGYIDCSLVELVGCEECMRRFNEELDEEEGEEEVPKKTYWTKCGRKFEKNSTADVTGYEIKDEVAYIGDVRPAGRITDDQCRACPFVNKVTEGYGEKERFLRFECRAGSKEPNHKTEWTGSLDDKNTIGINSLDHQLLEEIRQFCTDHPDLNSSYNADHLADCRRTLSVSCSANKKGIAAKKVLVEKFFPVQQSKSCRFCANFKAFKKANHAGAFGVCHKNGGQYPVYIPDSKCKDYTPVSPSSEASAVSATSETQDICGDCTHLIDDGSCVAGYARCDYKNRRMAKDHEACTEFDQVVFPECSTEDCPFNDREGCCLFAGEDPESDGYQDDVVKAVDEHGCSSEEVLLVHKAITDPDSFDLPEDDDETGNCLNCGHNKDKCEEYQSVGIANPEKHACENWQQPLPEQEKRKPRIGSQGCQEMREDCPCFCAHNDACAVLVCTGDAPRRIIQEFNKKFNIDCDVYREVSARVLNSDKAINKEETGIELAETAVSTPTFDYSTVDQETASFLQEKANKITEIRIKSVISIGKELKEAQSKLASHDGGTFIAWTESLGLSKSSTYNYINAYNWVVQNLDNLDDAERIQPSILFAASKPSAPAELQQAVASGDITSHKDYKDALARLKKAEEALSAQQTIERDYRNRVAELEKKGKDSQVYYETAHETRMREIRQLEQRLDQARHNGDPAKVRELGEVIKEKQQEISNYQEEIGRKNKELNELRQQLKDKPIEATAARVVEVIPREIVVAITERIDNLLCSVREIDEAEMALYAKETPDFSIDDTINAIDWAIKTFESFKSKLLKIVDNQSNPKSGCNCGSCAFADMDGVSEVQLDDEKTLCTQSKQVVDFDHCCSKFRHVNEGR